MALGLSGAYDPERALRSYSEAGRVALGAVLGKVLLAGALFMTYRETSRLQFRYFFAASLTLLLTNRTALRILHIAFGRIRPGGRGRVLILGAGELGRTVGKVVLDHSRSGFELAGFLDDDVGKHSQQFSGIPVLGKLDAVGQVIDEQAIDEVWKALTPRAHDRLYSAVAALETYPVQIKVVPDYFSLALVKARAEILGGIPVIGLREPIIEGAPRLLKRAFDLVVGIVLLVIAAPVVALIGLGIRLNSPGPAVFAQKRYGENGRIFDMYKFRTVIGKAVARSEPVMPRDEGEVSHKRREDPRVTRVGSFPRHWSLDELPQLINVIRGRYEPGWPQARTAFAGRSVQALAAQAIRRPTGNYWLVADQWPRRQTHAPEQAKRSLLCLQPLLVVRHPDPGANSAGSAEAEGSLLIWNPGPHKTTP